MIEKILERLREEKEAYSDTTYYVYGVEAAIKIVQEVAKEYVTDTNVGKWIPVEERLPELCKEVLVTQIFDNGNCNVTNASLIPMLDGSERVKWCSYDHFISYVVAWQPLPASYTEGRVKYE